MTPHYRVIMSSLPQAKLLHRNALCVVSERKKQIEHFLGQRLCLSSCFFCWRLKRSLLQQSMILTLSWAKVGIAVFFLLLQMKTVCWASSMAKLDSTATGFTTASIISPVATITYWHTSTTRNHDFSNTLIIHQVWYLVLISIDFDNFTSPFTP